MPLPQPPRNDNLDCAMLAWVVASNRLAATLIAGVQCSDRPQLTLAPDPCMGLACAVIFCPLLRLWQHVFHCLCQWRLAFELHPGWLHAETWGYAAAASIAWQIFDRLKTQPGASDRRHPRDPRGSQAVEA